MKTYKKEEKANITYQNVTSSCQIAYLGLVDDNFTSDI